MKKAIAVFLAACTMVLSLSACAGGKSGWKDDDFIFTNGSDTVTVNVGQIGALGSDAGMVASYADDSVYQQLNAGYTTNRGLKVGDSIDEYKKLYTVINGYALWEINTNDGWSTIVHEYNNESPSEAYGFESDIYSVYLDIGFYKKDGKWAVLRDYELRDVWFCDASLSTYSECAILTVGFDSMGRIGVIDIYHINYDQDWKTFQDWE